MKGFARKGTLELGPPFLQMTLCPVPLCRPASAGDTVDSMTGTQREVLRRERFGGQILTLRLSSVWPGAFVSGLILSSGKMGGQ